MRTLIMFVFQDKLDYLLCAALYEDVINVLVCWSTYILHVRLPYNNIIYSSINASVQVPLHKKA